MDADYSHLHPEDRPPPIIYEDIRVGNRLHWDKSDTREPIPQIYPGTDIRELHNKHRGKVALLFNGASLNVAGLWDIRVPMVGMNRTYVGHSTWAGPQPHYLCVVDSCWLDGKEGRREVREHQGLINGSLDPRSVGYRATKSFRMAPWSFDLSRDGYVPPTCGMLALQVAAYLGFTEIYCLGLDLGGDKHYDGSRSASVGNLVSQKKYMEDAAPELAARGITLRLMGAYDSPAFMRGSFAELCN